MPGESTGNSGSVRSLAGTVDGAGAGILGGVTRSTAGGVLVGVKINLSDGGKIRLETQFLNFQVDATFIGGNRVSWGPGRNR